MLEPNKKLIKKLETLFNVNIYPEKIISDTKKDYYLEKIQERNRRDFDSTHYRILDRLKKKQQKDDSGKNLKVINNEQT